jgi:ribose/xylose/arabinose/galactoside ABC-type transport system permease subunit
MTVTTAATDAADADDDRTDVGRRRRAQVVEALAREGFIVIFAAWAIYLTIFTDTFLTEGNVLILLRQAAIFAIIGIGTTLVAILGELDISFGATLALAGCVAAAWLVGGTSPLVAIVIAVAIGAVIGLANGVLVNYVRIPSVVATLGMLGVVEGLAAMYTGGSSIFGDDLDKLTFLSRDELLGIPVPVVIAFAMYAVAWLVTTRTRFGAHLYATGDNREAAYRSGISVQRIRLVVFIVAGALAGFGGLMQTARLGRAQATMGADALFPVLTAVILGGVSLSGGRGRVVNTLIASVFLASITNGLILLGVATEVQRVVQGAVLILAVSLDRLRT